MDAQRAARQGMLVAPSLARSCAQSARVSFAFLVPLGHLFLVLHAEFLAENTFDAGPDLFNPGNDVRLSGHLHRAKLQPSPLEPVLILAALRNHGRLYLCLGAAIAFALDGAGILAGSAWRA